MRLLNSDAEFEAIMDEIDGAIQNEGALIVGRELKVEFELYRRLRLRILSNFARRQPPVSGEYTTSNIGSHVDAWMEKKYGDRLKIDPSYGQFAAILDGDAWLVRAPMIIGQAVLVADRNLRTEYPNQVVGAPVQINVLGLVKDLTETMAQKLQEADIQRLCEQFRAFYNCCRLITIGDKENGSLARLALLDLTSGAQKVVRDHREYGSARWDALQAAEKFLKHYIDAKGQKFQWSHDLSDLVAKAQLSGPLNIRTDLIASASTSASVRYKPFHGTVIDVVSALNAAAEIGLAVASDLYGSAKG